MNKKLLFGIFILFSFVLNSNLILGVESSLNISSKDYALACLDNSKQIMNTLMNDGFNTKRINDSIRLAEQIFDSQSKIEQRGGKVDYSSVSIYCKDIENIEVFAYEAKDSLYSLEINFNSFKEKVSEYNVNISEVESMVKGIKEDIVSERYENVPEDVLTIENKMTDIESTSTAVNLFYSAVTTSISGFFINNYIKILITLLVLIILFFAYKLRIKRWVILRKIDKLESEKKVLKDLIRKAQYGYFHQGDLSKGSFSIKMNKYSEMVRDIDRQIPLLNESLAIVESKLRKTSVKKEIIRGAIKRKEIKKIVRKRARKKINVKKVRRAIRRKRR